MKFKEWLAREFVGDWEYQQDNPFRLAGYGHERWLARGVDAITQTINKQHQASGAPSGMSQGVGYSPLDRWADPYSRRGNVDHRNIPVPMAGSPRRNIVVYDPDTKQFNKKEFDYLAKALCYSQLAYEDSNTVNDRTILQAKGKYVITKVTQGLPEGENIIATVQFRLNPKAASAALNPAHIPPPT